MSESPWMSDSELKVLFNSPIDKMTAFKLLTELKVRDSKGINDIFRVFIESITEGRSEGVTPACILVSCGIYLSFILRYVPETKIYAKNKLHFIIAVFQVYNPFIRIYITYFLLPCIILGVDMGVNESDTSTRSVMDRLIAECPVGSLERKMISTVKRLRTASPISIIDRLRLSDEKKRLSIFLDDPSLFPGELDDDDIMTCIFCHSQNILSKVNRLRPRHFSRAVACLNLDIVLRSNDCSDYLENEIFDEFLYYCKKLKHAVCREILMIVVTKNITLCEHRIAKIPSNWIEDVMSVYSTPRWKSSKSNATIQFYSESLGTENAKEFMTSICEDPEFDIKELCSKVTDYNKTYYIVASGSYTDFISDVDVSIVNHESLVLDDVFEIPVRFVMYYREDSNVFLFAYPSWSNIVRKGLNPYTRKPIRDEFLSEMERRLEKYRSMGFSPMYERMEPLLTEIINGRQPVKHCSCRKDYRVKLLRELKAYSVSDSSLDLINIEDIKIKLFSIGLVLKSECRKELFEHLYKAIKSSNPKSREKMRQAIANYIIIYSQSNERYILEI